MSAESQVSPKEAIEAWLDAAGRVTNAAPTFRVDKETGIVTLSYNAAGGRVRIQAGPVAECAPIIAPLADKMSAFPRLYRDARWECTHKGGIADSAFPVTARKNGAGSSTASGEKKARTPRTTSGKTGDKIPKELAIARADVKTLSEKIDSILAEYAKLGMYRETLAALTATRDNLEKQHTDKLAADKSEKERAEKERAEEDAAKLAKEAATEAKAIAAAEKAQKQAEKLLAKVAALKARAEELKNKARPADAIPVPDVTGQSVVGQTV